MKPFNLQIGVVGRCYFAFEMNWCAFGHFYVLELAFSETGSFAADCRIRKSLAGPGRAPTERVTKADRAGH
uniref:Uncharacterized protein n=1 Tax=Romanomermis culicivorax TaxID=13658 RepID=A0A915K316_ROMCU